MKSEFCEEAELWWGYADMKVGWLWELCRLVIGACIQCAQLSLTTIRYDASCYFNVRSKADVSQLNLPVQGPVHTSNCSNFLKAAATSALVTGWKKTFVSLLSSTSTSSVSCSVVSNFYYRDTFDNRLSSQTPLHETTLSHSRRHSSETRRIGPRKVSANKPLL